MEGSKPGTYLPSLFVSCFVQQQVFNYSEYKYILAEYIYQALRIFTMAIWAQVWS